MWNIEKIIKKGDYLYAKVKNHPYATKNGYVLMHRVVAENHLKRLLNADEVVHHKDGNKKNNEIDNLEVQSVSDHAKLHGMEQLATIVDLKCPSCSQVFTRRKSQTHLSKKGRWTACSRSCRGKFSRLMQLHGKTHEVDLAISENVLSEYLGKLRANRDDGMRRDYTPDA